MLEFLDFARPQKVKLVSVLGEHLSSVIADIAVVGSKNTPKKSKTRLILFILYPIQYHSSNLCNHLLYCKSIIKSYKREVKSGYYGRAIMTYSQIATQPSHK